MTTRDYGSWGQKVPSEGITLESGVADALNGEYTDAEEWAIIAAYRDAINAALPDSVSLCGNQFYGPHGEPDYLDGDYPLCDSRGEPAGDAPPWADRADYQCLDIAAIVASVDFWAIVQGFTA